MADAKVHGTLRGGGRYRQRLFQEQVDEIASSNESILFFSRKYGIEPSHIARVRRTARTA